MEQLAGGYPPYKISADDEDCCTPGYKGSLLNGEKGYKTTFNGPKGLALSKDETYLFVADSYNHVIRAVLARTYNTGGSITMAGSGTCVPYDACGKPGECKPFSVCTSGFRDGDGAAALFNDPWSLHVSKDGKTLYVADRRPSVSIDVTIFFLCAVDLTGHGNKKHSVKREPRPVGMPLHRA